MILSVTAPAKINLGLEIGKKRADGYHNVEMIMQSVSLYDEIDLLVDNSGCITVNSDIHLNCSLESNIAFRAAKEFLNYVKMPDTGVRIKIKKNIPMCAGMAGGSADGAAVIWGLNKILGLKLANENLCEIGEKIGSDVPFCIVGGTAYASGRGTKLEKLNSLSKCHIMIVKPDLSISTAKAYEDFDNLKIHCVHDLSLLKSAINSGDLSKVCERLYNRFEEVINEHEIFEIKKRMKNYGAEGSLMTGSGSAVYGIFQDEICAKKCFDSMKKLYPNSYLTQPIDRGVAIM